MHNNLQEWLSEVLYYKWDPIGVKDCVSSRDEYDSYISWIIDILNKNPDVSVLTHYLSEVETQEMGLTSDTELNSIVSWQMVEVYTYLFNK